jgi:cytochrome c556
MKRMTRSLVVLILILGIIGAANAQFSRPEDAINYRQSVMFLIAQHFGRIAAVIKEQSPYDSDSVAQNAMLVETLSKLPWEAFAVPGTDGGKTRLKSIALEKPDQFRQEASEFEAASTKLAGVTKHGQLDAIKAPFGDVAKSCQSCHEQFRSQ